MISSGQIGVCGWCIDRLDVVRGIEIAATELKISTLQIGFFGDEALQRADAKIIEAALTTHGVSLAGSFLAFSGEDYTSIKSIGKTGGFMHDDLFEHRLDLLKEAAVLTAELGAPVLAIHAGTIPQQRSSLIYPVLRDRVGQAADVVGPFGVRLLLETGREPIDTLVEFIDQVDRSNIGISFDPGNLVIYGTDDPVRSIPKLKGRIGIVHLKDAVRSDQPGVAFGQPAPLGMGDVQIPRVLSKLRIAGYDGPLLLEVRSQRQDRSDLKEAISYMRSMS